jgi:hypothetical protein
VQTGLQQQYIGALQRELKCWPHLAYLDKRRLFNRREWSGNGNTCFQDGGQIQSQKNVDHDNES